MTVRPSRPPRTEVPTRSPQPAAQVQRTFSIGMVQPPKTPRHRSDSEGKHRRPARPGHHGGQPRRSPRAQRRRERRRDRLLPEDRSRHVVAHDLGRVRGRRRRGGQGPHRGGIQPRTASSCRLVDALRVDTRRLRDVGRGWGRRPDLRDLVGRAGPVDPVGLRSHPRSSSRPITTCRPSTRSGRTCRAHPDLRDRGAGWTHFARRVPPSATRTSTPVGPASTARPSRRSSTPRARRADRRGAS